MENIKIIDSSNQIILTGTTNDDVGGYFLEEVNTGEDMTSDILQLALREASQDTCNGIDNGATSFDPIDELSVQLVQTRCSNSSENSLQPKLTPLSNRDLTTSISQCESDMGLNENLCFFAVENNENVINECSVSANSLSIGIEQLVDSLNNFNSNQLVDSNVHSSCSIDNGKTISNSIISSHSGAVGILQNDKIQNHKKDGFENSLINQSCSTERNANRNVLQVETPTSTRSFIPISSLTTSQTSNINVSLSSNHQIKYPATLSLPSCSSVPVLPNVSYATTSVPTSLLLTDSCSQPKSYVPIQIATPASKNTSIAPAPLGSSNNPIQVIQHGNTYHASQTLTNEQLQQIALVIQQQQQQQSIKINEGNNGAVLYNPDTNTRIIYRVVYPSDSKSITESNRLNSKEKTDSVTRNATSSCVVAKGRGRPRKTWSKKVEPDLPRVDGQELSKEEKEEKKKHRPRTRYGRISKPPSYMIKDYKRIHHLDFDQEPYDDSDGGYSDFQQSEDEGEERRIKSSTITTDLNILTVPSEKENRRILPPGVTTIKPRNYKCPACEKAYIGKGGLERHFRLAPGHGSIEEIEDHAQEIFSDENSNTSVASHGSAVCNGNFTFSQAPGQTSREVSPENEKSRSILINSHHFNAVPNKNIPQPTQLINQRNKQVRHSAAYYSRRKAKLKELVQPYQDDELFELLLPRLSKEVNLWDFLLLKTERGNPAEPHIPDIFKHFEDLVERLQMLAKECLIVSPVNPTSTITSQNAISSVSKENSQIIERGKLYVEIRSAKVAQLLNIRAGLYQVRQQELMELVPSFTKPPKKRKLKEDESTLIESDNEQLYIKPKRSCIKTLSNEDLLADGDESNSSQTLNFITSTSMINASVDSLGDLTISDPVTMIGSHSLDLAQLGVGIASSEPNTIESSSPVINVNNESDLVVSINKPQLNSSVPVEPTSSNEGSLPVNDSIQKSTIGKPMCTKSDVLTSTTPSNMNVNMPSLSLDNSLLFGTMSLSPSSLVTDLKSSHLFHAKKSNLFGNNGDINQDSFLSLHNNDDSIAEDNSKTNKNCALQNISGLTCIQDGQATLLHSVCGSGSHSETSSTASNIVNNCNVLSDSVSKSSSCNVESCLVNQDGTSLFGEETHISNADNMSLFKDDSPSNDANDSVLMGMCSKTNQSNSGNYQKIVVDLQQESEAAENNSCLIGLLVNSNENKLTNSIDDSTLNHLDLEDMNEEVTNMFEKHSTETEGVKQDDLESSFFPGNVIIVQNPDGTTTLQVPGNQVLSLETLQALLGLEQTNPLSSIGNTVNLGNSITLNSQLSDDAALLENLHD